ncbi:class I SAM-dependent methyltransferase [candidate division TA06 bacterium]|nr:class I SAM-dependent methyltransferase [candidate division TA06 bacterium]
MVEPKRENWQRFWEEKERSKSVYPTVSDIVGELIRICPDLQKKRVLEVGCGTGRDGIELAEREAEVFLLDFAKSGLALSHYFSAEKGVMTHRVMGDARRTPFPDESFDILFHQGLLEHFRDPRPLLRENFRLLKKGGILLVDVPQTFHPYTLMKHVLLFFGRWFAGWEREFTPQSLKRVIEREGFQMIRSYGYWMRPGLAYRVLREFLQFFKISLPMYPTFLSGIFKFFYRLIDRVSHHQIFHYTSIAIGLVATKNNMGSR